jgi:radical SAM superfamily enzyme YgiQ (UPF0313 family)
MNVASIKLNILYLQQISHGIPLALSVFEHNNTTRRVAMNEEPYKKKKVLSLSKRPSVLLVHPTTLNNTEHIPVQSKYFESMRQTGLSLMGDDDGEQPLGLLCVGGALEKAGCDVKLIDFNLMDLRLRKSGRSLTDSHIRNALSSEKPQIIGITAMTTQEKSLLDIVAIAKEIHPEAEIIVGGIHPAFQATPILQKSDAIDVVVRGEGEVAMVELVRGVPKEQILGITFRGPNGLVSTPERPLLKPQELNALPFPAYHLLPDEAFPLTPRVLPARGCPGQCGFCVVNRFFRNRVRCRKPSVVVDEIEFLLDNFEIARSPIDDTPFIIMGDLSFGATRQSMLICNEIISRGINVHWWCQTRSDIIVRGKVDLKRMVEAGCRYLALGIESANQEQLNKSGKGIEPVQSVKALQMAKEAGLLTQGYFILGLAGETRVSAISTIDFMERLMREGLLDITHISMNVPYPGTEMFEDPEENGILRLSPDFDKYKMGAGEFDGGKPPYDTRNMSDSEIFLLWQIALDVAARNYTSPPVARSLVAG